MKIFYLDPNNTTPQYNYPFIEKLNQENVNAVLFTSKNENFTNYYDEIYKIDSNYFFFKFENKIKIEKLRKFLKMLLYPLRNYKLISMIKGEKPQIVHYNWLAFPIIDSFMIKKIQRLGTKVILSVHDYKQHDKSKLRMHEESVFKRVNRIICLSEYVKNQFSSQYHSKISVIPHGNCYEKELEKYSAINSDSDEYSVLMTGNIKPYKGAEILIDAMNSLKDTENIKAEIAGRISKEYKKKISEKYSNVSFDFGFIDHNQLYMKIAQCDAGILPYLRATQSGLPYIFAYFKKPLIVTNSGGLPEQVSADFAEVVEPNPESIAEGILRIRNRKILDSTFDSFLKKYSWQKTVEKYIDLYRELVSE